MRSMNSLRRFRTALAAPLLALVASAQTQVAPSGPQDVHADALSGPTANLLSPIYRLDRHASWSEGCFLNCLCPIWESPAFRGTFELEPLPTLDPFFRSWKVKNVNWLVRRPGGAEERVIGEGIYRASNNVFNGLQQLTLDLIIGAEDNPPVQFDSGLVPGGGGGRLPRIDIRIDMNDLACFDTLIRVRAQPIPKVQFVHFELAPTSTYQEGCLPPCLCPLLQEQPVVGSFDLVRIFSEPNFTEAAVVNVDWAILPPPPSPLPFFTPVEGEGIYRLEGPLAVSPAPRHQMILDLQLGGDGDRWDSGLVPGASPPTIAIDLAANGFFCFDRVFSIKAFQP